jgi:tetratricopeptide (TPR) repeat protein
MAETTGAIHNEAMTWKIQGNINYKQGNYKEALLFYDKGLEADPDNTDIWNNKGMTLVKLGRIDEARKCQQEIKRLKEHSGAREDTFPADAIQEPGRPSHCTVKIRGVPVNDGPARFETAQALPDFSETNLEGDLQLRDIEQNIELIKHGLEEVRLGRVEEARQCDLQIKQMEDNISLTMQGLGLIKKNRVEEARKIKQVEKNIEMTRTGLEQIKIARLDEARHYQEQLTIIEENIDLTRRRLLQGKPGEKGAQPESKEQERRMQGNPVKAEPVARHDTAVIGTENTHQIKDIEDIIGLPEEVDKPASPGRIRLASIMFIFLVVLVLSYFAFFR